MDVARGVVKTAADAVLLIFPHQLIEHLIGRLSLGGNNALRDRAGCKAGGRSEK